MRRALTLIGLTTLWLMALSGSPATGNAAARYVLEKCDSALPGGGTEGATFTGQPPFVPGNDCAEQGGSIFVVQQGNANTGHGFWSLPIPPPPGGVVESITVTGSMCNGAHGDAGTVGFAVAPGWSLNCQTETHRYSINSASRVDAQIWLGCEGFCEGNPEVWAGGFAATEVDPVAPRIASLGGTLLAGGVIHGHQTVTASLTDEGGGVASAVLHVNGTAVEGPRDFPCQTVKVSNSSVTGIVAAATTPCPAVAESGWALDTETFPFHNGRNTLQVCAMDFSTIGPANEACAEKRIRVDNSCPQSLVGGGENLYGVFKRNERQQVTVAFGEAMKIAGRLMSATHQPLSGATVCVWARTLGGHQSKRLLQTLTTDAQGHYSYLLAAGPNQAVTVGYRQDARQLERHLRYLARARPTLHSSSRHLRNGRWVHFGGTLPGPSRRGRVVILQAGVVGSRRWITFRKAISGRRGHFHASYRFTSTTRKTTYRFRALVPRQLGYPWESGHSAPVDVVVRH